jgi:hypothetical protein
MLPASEEWSQIMAESNTGFSQPKYRIHHNLQFSCFCRILLPAWGKIMLVVYSAVFAEMVGKRKGIPFPCRRFKPFVLVLTTNSIPSIREVLAESR